MHVAHPCTLGCIPGPGLLVRSVLSNHVTRPSPVCMPRSLMPLANLLYLMQYRQDLFSASTSSGAL